MLTKYYESIKMLLGRGKKFFEGYFKMKKFFLAGLLLTLIFVPATVFANADETNETAVFVTTSRLNLREKPTTDSTRITTVALGKRVEVVDFGCGEWFEVNVDGKTGFMFAEHLRELTDADASANFNGDIELLEWRDAKNVMTYGTIATIIDVRTGLSWEMASFSNGNHSDVEPISADDTATMKQAFGKWMWTPRPVIVVINGRNLAASINGMPHGGSTRSGNNMNGHVCLHFKGSTTHRTAASHVRDHQNAVMEAFAGMSA